MLKIDYKFEKIYQNENEKSHPLLIFKLCFYSIVLKCIIRIRLLNRKKVTKCRMRNHNLTPPLRTHLNLFFTSHPNNFTDLL